MGSDPLITIREYGTLAPWNLRDLAAVAAAILDASAVRPTNTAASTQPNERTIRFYVTRGLVTPPEGRGTAAVYSYRHLLQVLAIKVRQMEGATLATIKKELNEMSGDVLERWVASALDSGLPSPSELPLGGEERMPRGRSGRVYRRLHSEPTATDAPPGTTVQEGMTGWKRMPIARGVELHMREDHALAKDPDRAAEIANGVRLALSRILAEGEQQNSA